MRTLSTAVPAALAALAAFAISSTAAVAQTTVQGPWVRGTVAGQKATGLFATLTSAKGGTLVAASSPAAARVEIHEMAMAGDVMKMRELPAGLPLPAGKPVALKPGGYHLMLMDLKQPLAAGATVELMLTIEGADKKRETVAVKAVVKALSDSAGHGKH